MTLTRPFTAYNSHVCKADRAPDASKGGGHAYSQCSLPADHGTLCPEPVTQPSLPPTKSSPHSSYGNDQGCA